MQENIILIALGLIGVLVQCLIKLNGLLTDARVANINFNWKKDYVVRDFIPILISFLSIIIWYFVFGEIAAKVAWIVNFKRLSFLVVAGNGSWLIQYLFGKSKDWIRNIVDRKTDIADGKTKP